MSFLIDDDLRFEDDAGPRPTVAANRVRPYGDRESLRAVLGAFAEYRLSGSRGGPAGTA